jgi:hypothetical protein
VTQMERIRGDAESWGGAGDLESHAHLRSTGEANPDATTDRSRSQRLREGVRDRFDDASERVRESVGGGLERLADTIDSRTGAITAARKYPLVAVGIAFSVGLAIAAMAVAEERDTPLERVRRRLKALTISWIGAAVAKELRDVIAAGEDVEDSVESFLEDHEIDI